MLPFRWQSILSQSKSVFCCSLFQQHRSSVLRSCADSPAELLPPAADVAGVAAEELDPPAAAAAPPGPAHSGGRPLGNWTLTVEHSCWATCSVFWTSFAEHALATQQEMSLMKALSAQMHLTSVLQFIGRVAAQGLCERDFSSQTDGIKKRVRPVGWENVQHILAGHRMMRSARSRARRAPMQAARIDAW